MKLTTAKTLSTLLALCSALAGVAAAEEISVGTWNIKFFFDANSSDNSEVGRQNSAPSETDFEWRVETVAAAIAEMTPTLLALQEVESEEVVLAVAEQLESVHDMRYQVAFVQGRDTFTGQDVALLVRRDIKFEQDRFSFRRFRGNPEFKGLSKHLHVSATIAGEKFSIIVVHLRTDLESRKRQAKTLAAWISEDVEADNLIVLGDFNVGLRFESTFAESDIGTIRGLNNNDPDDDLTDLHEFLTAGDRVTHVGGKQLDRILVSKPLCNDEGIDFIGIERPRDLAIRGSVVDRGSWGTPEHERDLSDHFPLLAVFDAPDERPVVRPRPPDRATVIRQLRDAVRELEVALERVNQRVEALEGAP